MSDYTNYSTKPHDSIYYLLALIEDSETAASVSQLTDRALQDREDVSTTRSPALWRLFRLGSKVLR